MADVDTPTLSGLEQRLVHDLRKGLIDCQFRLGPTASREKLIERLRPQWLKKKRIDELEKLIDQLEDPADPLGAGFYLEFTATLSHGSGHANTKQTFAKNWWVELIEL